MDKMPFTQQPVWNNSLCSDIVLFSHPFPYVSIRKEIIFICSYVDMMVYLLRGEIVFVPEESILCVSAIYSVSSFKRRWLWSVGCAHGRSFPLQNLICSECGDEFTLQSQLAVHMEEHRQELAASRTHACKACGEGFETPPQLKEHMKTHYKVRCEPLLGLETIIQHIKNGPALLWLVDRLHVLAALETRTGQLISRGVGMSFIACVMCRVYSRTGKVENLNVILCG